MRRIGGTSLNKTLVTGGAGFVGRHLIKSLLERGDKVVCIDPVVPLSGGLHPKSGWPFYNPFDFKNFEFHEMDCREFFQRDKSSDYTYCFHLAAIVGGRKMIENDPLAVAQDLSIDAAFWKWTTETKPKKSICFSSSAAYPIRFQTKDNYSLLKEDMIRFDNDLGLPDMTYGWAKLTSEYLAKLAYEKHGISSVCYRPFSGYGEDQDLNYPFPSIVKRVQEKKKNDEVVVWGSGRQMRDFIHIEDCVRGILGTVDKINDASAINLSTGLYTSMMDFASLVSDVLGLDLSVKGMDKEPEGVYARAGDTTLQRKLGFQHQIEFKEGIKRALAYFG